jgi:outer membrane protein assembly factor BamB
MKGTPAALAVVLLASACTGGTTRKPSPTFTPPGEVVTKATATPLRFGERPLWTGGTKGAPRRADGFALHGESLVMFNGPDKDHLDRLSVVDAATGKPRWSVSPARPLPGGHGESWYGRGTFDSPQVVDRGRDWGVLVTTVREGSTRQKAYGLALLSGENGQVLWRRPLVAATDAPAHDRYVYPAQLLTDGGTALVSLHPEAGGPLAELKLTAVDALSGKRLWTRTGLRPSALAAGSVVATEWPGPTSAPLDDTRTGTVTVLSAATGRTRWSLSGRMPAASAFAVAAGLLVVREVRNGRLGAPVILDVTAGTEVGRMPETTGNCADDGTALIACDTLVPEPRVFTIRADERRLRVSGHETPVGPVTLVKDGRLYYGDTDAPGEETDRSGTPLAGALPSGLLKALSE